MKRGQTSPHFDLPKARRDTAAHHVRALAWSCATVGVLILAFAALLSVFAE